MTEFPLDTLILPEAAAKEAWDRWRAGLDIDSLPYESQQMLAAVAGRLPAWLNGDPAAALFQGIVKMVWSRNQMRLHRAAEVHGILHKASIEPAAIVGPLAWTLCSREEGAIRAIPHLTMLIRREQLASAGEALASDGWSLSCPLPEGDALDWSCFVPLTKGEETLHLHWRMLPAAPEKALAPERAMLERTRPVAWKQHTFQTISPEADLLHRLADRSSWDPVSWQADALMMPFADVDWRRFGALGREQPELLNRLLEVRRDWSLRIPETKPFKKHVLTIAMERAYAARPRIAHLRSLARRGRLLWKS